MNNDVRVETIFDCRRLYRSVDFRRRKLRSECQDAQKIEAERTICLLKLNHRVVKSHKPIFIRFTKSENDIRVFFHDITRSVVHQLERALIVWLDEIMLFREPSSTDSLSTRFDHKISRTDEMSVRQVGRP